MSPCLHRDLCRGRLLSSRLCRFHYSEHAPIRSRRQDPGVGLVARILRTRRPHSPPRHDVLWSTVVLHSTDRAHRGTTIRSAGQPGQGLARSALRCSPTPGKHTDTTGTRPQISCAQRHRSTAHLSPIRNITSRTHYVVIRRMSRAG